MLTIHHATAPLVKVELANYLTARATAYPVDLRGPHHASWQMFSGLLLKLGLPEATLHRCHPMFDSLGSR